MVKDVARRYHCARNPGRFEKQVDSIVNNLTTNLETSKIYISNASEELFELLGIVSQLLVKTEIQEEEEEEEEDKEDLSSKILTEEFCSSTQLERKSSSNSKVSCCGCSIEERKSNNKHETTRDNTERTLNSDVKAAKATILRRPGLGILVYLKGEKRSKENKASSNSNTSFLDLRRSFNKQQKKEISGNFVENCEEYRTEDKRSFEGTANNVSSPDLAEVKKLSTTEKQSSSSYSAKASQEPPFETENTLLRNVHPSIENFSTVLQSVMEGIENCSQLASSLSSSSIAANPPSERVSLRSEDISLSSFGDADRQTNFKSSQGDKMDSLNDIGPPPTKVFDFAEGDSKEILSTPELPRGVLRSGKEYHRQSIDFEAKFARGRSKSELHPQNNSEQVNKNEATRIVSFDDTVGEKEYQFGKKKKNSKESQNNKITRSKSENSIKGIKRFRLKFFSRKNRSKSVKVKEEVIPAEMPAWDDFGLAQTGNSQSRQGSLTSGASEGRLKKSGSKEEFFIEPDVTDKSSSERDISGWSATEVLDKDPEQASQYTESQDFPEQDETEKAIKQLEQEKIALNAEKMDLMNALSNIWIEMEDLKNLYEEEKEKTAKRNSFVGFPPNTESSPNGPGSNVNNSHNGSPCQQSEKEQKHLESMLIEIKELNNLNESLRFEKTMQSQTIISLQKTLTTITEDQEAVSRKKHRRAEDNKEEGSHSSNSKETPRISKLKDENFSLKSRLDNVLNAKLLLEKHQQTTQLENKQMNEWKLQVQEMCINLTQKIDKELQTIEDATPVASKTINKENGLNVPERLDKNRPSHSIIPEFESSESSDSDAYHSANAVQNIVKNIERSRSTDSELNTLGRFEEEKTLWSNGIRRSVTMSSLSTHKSLSSDDKGIPETKLSRFPPPADKSRKEIKSQNNDKGTLPVKKKNSDSEKMAFIFNLESSCLKLLKRYKEMKIKPENKTEGMKQANQSKTIKGKMSPQTSLEGPGKGNSEKKQSESVLYLCLRNLQKENDVLKLDNLNLQAKVNEMQDTIRVENGITIVEKSHKKVLVKQVQEKELSLEDSGHFDSFINERLSKANGLEPETDGKPFDDIDGIKLDKNEEKKKDVSSWHRKHSEKKSRESSKANRKKELQKDRNEVFNEFEPRQTFEEIDGFSSRTSPSLSRMRAKSLDRGLDEVNQFTFLTKREEQPENSSREKEGYDKDHVSEDSLPVLADNMHTANSTSHVVLARLSKLEQEQNASQTRKETKTVKKALSTCGSRERFTVHYV